MTPRPDVTSALRGLTDGFFFFYYNPDAGAALVPQDLVSPRPLTFCAPASVTGSGASAAARLRDRRVLRRWCGLIPIQRVRPEEGTAEAESARIQFKQDKAGAARLEDSRAAGGALEETFLRHPSAALCRALWTLFFFLSLFPCRCFHFLKIENHLENNNDNNNKMQNAKPRCLKKKNIFEYIYIARTSLIVWSPFQAN